MHWHNRQKELEKLAQNFNEDSTMRNQLGWMDSIGDAQRYSYDPYDCRVFITKMANKITVSITLMHYFMGGVMWQDFWHFEPGQYKSAKKTYNSVKKAAHDVFNQFQGRTIPTALVHSYLREAVRFIDPEARPTTRIPYIDWSREQPGVSDWRNSIYGNRYPETSGF